ncbi:hypothetical protein BU15DRAFT_63303 [Melanogaster broomeanus]|nr:hypothetical protein BU15DRAFT_63303 [Melanogaster broomeanus]
MPRHTAFVRTGATGSPTPYTKHCDNYFRITANVLILAEVVLAIIYRFQGQQLQGRALRAEGQEGREEGREEGQAEERAALERERAALAARDQELLRVKEELASQSRGAAAN